MNYDGLEPVAGWQPLYAPSFQDSLWDFRSAFAGIGTAPTFAPLTGWTSAGSAYLTTTVVPTHIHSVIISYKGFNANGSLFGNYRSSPTGYFSYERFSGVFYYENGPYVAGTSSGGAGTIAIAGKLAYLNGLYDKTIGAGATPALAIYLFCRNKDGSTPDNYANVTIAAFAIYDVLLTPDQIWQRTQMINNLQEPDWNVWAPARQWFCVPPLGVVRWRGVGRNSSPVGQQHGAHRL